MKIASSRVIRFQVISRQAIVACFLVFYYFVRLGLDVWSFECPKLRDRQTKSSILLSGQHNWQLNVPSGSQHARDCHKLISEAGLFLNRLVEYECYRDHMCNPGLLNTRVTFLSLWTHSTWEGLSLVIVACFSMGTPLRFISANRIG